MKTKMSSRCRVCEITMAACFAAVMYVLKLLEPYYKSGKQFDLDGARLFFWLCFVLVIGGAVFAKEFRLVHLMNEDEDEEKPERPKEKEKKIA